MSFRSRTPNIHHIEEEGKHETTNMQHRSMLLCLCSFMLLGLKHVALKGQVLRETAENCEMCWERSAKVCKEFLTRFCHVAVALHFAPNREWIKSDEWTQVYHHEKTLTCDHSHGRSYFVNLWTYGLESPRSCKDQNWSDEEPDTTPNPNARIPY